MSGLFLVSTEFYEGGRDFIPKLSDLYLRSYFQDLITKNKSKIFSIEFDKKGIITTKSVEGKLQGECYLINLKRKERYVLEFTKKGPLSFNEYQSTTYYQCSLEKIISSFDIKRIRKQKNIHKRKLDIPKEVVVAGLIVSYEEDERIYTYEEAWINYWSLRIVIKGEENRLIRQVYNDIEKVRKKYLDHPIF